MPLTGNLTEHFPERGVSHVQGDQSPTRDPPHQQEDHQKEGESEQQDKSVERDRCRGSHVMNKTPQHRKSCGFPKGESLVGQDFPCLG